MEMRESQPTGNSRIDASPDWSYRLAEILFSTHLTGTTNLYLNGYSQEEEIEKTLLDVRQALLALANGELNFDIKSQGVLAEALKSIQAHLLHLTWQTKQVVCGDFSQRAAYMGEFSNAFNTLVEQLAGMTNELQIQQDELIRRNDTLICEVEERERAEQAEREQRQLAEAMVAAAKALSATLELDEVMDIMLEKIADVVPYDSAVIMQVDGTTAFTRRARNYQRYGYDIETKIKNARFNIKETPNLYTLITTMQPFVIPDVNHYDGWNKKITGNPVQSWLGTPVIAHGKVIALFSLDKLEPGFYTEEHAQKLKMFASHAALALENARLYQEVQRLAITDALTGLYNRRFFFERAVQELDRSRRYRHPLAMIMMDLDHFKKVNDKFGHPAGDLVLATIAQIARKQLRQSDIAARFGGEEFIFLLPETTPQQAEQIADRLRLSLAAYSIPYEGKIITVTASFGISGLNCVEHITDTERVIEQIIALSDEALYQAKQAGRNMVRQCLYSNGNPLD